MRKLRLKLLSITPPVAVTPAVPEEKSADIRRDNSEEKKIKIKNEKK